MEPRRASVSVPSLEARAMMAPRPSMQIGAGPTPRAALLDNLRQGPQVTERDPVFEAKRNALAEIEKEMMAHAKPGWQPAQFSADEVVRLKRLYDLDILDTPREESYDLITRLASQIFGTPIAAVSLVDGDRQWFKSEVGLGCDQTGRAEAFCPHTFSTADDVFVVPDAKHDDRFSQNPLVTGGPEIGFYAGAPLMSSDGYPLGTLCVIDRRPRELTVEQQALLKILASQVSHQLQLRKVLKTVEHSKAAADMLLANILPKTIAARLLSSETSRLSDAVEDCTCVFVDLAGFTNWASQSTPQTVVDTLDVLFSAFDASCTMYGVCKIKTIGDGYFCAAGVPEPLRDHAARAVRCSMSFLEHVKEFNETNGTSFRVRIGLSSGPAVAGVVGSTRIAYDLWGSTVNEASRCESNGVLDHVCISSTTRAKIEHDNRFEFFNERDVALKGLGTRKLCCVRMAALSEPEASDSETDASEEN